MLKMPALKLNQGLRFTLLKKFSINDTSDTFFCSLFGYYFHHKLPRYTPKYKRATTTVIFKWTKIIERGNL